MQLGMIRKTKQRVAILAAIEEAGRPLTVEEIHALGREKSPRLGLRTVYRQIRELVSDGTLVSLDYPGQSTRYEQVDWRHHPHFICSRCRKMYDFEKEAPDVPYTPPPGFTIEGEEIIFYGTCPDCAEKASG